MIPRRTGKAICAALLVALPALGSADVALSASVDAREVALDDSLVLRITARYSSRAGTGDVEVPAFADFDVVSRSRSEQVSFSFGGGGSSMDRTVTTTLTLTPKRIGDLTIEPVKLEQGGKTFQTEPIAIHVLPAGQAGRGGRGPDPLADRRGETADPFADVHPGQRDLLLRATVDNDHPFVGQQVTYS
ncbi:MAG: BatD family protein, partial [Myxococcales bacterium]